MTENTGESRALKILLVDDEKMIHKGLAPFLENLGHQVDSAYQGDEALEMLEESDYDLVLADVQMPKLDGMELLEKIGEIDADPAVIILTAHGDLDMVIKALRLGAADFMTKPVKFDDLEAAIEKSRRFRDFKLNDRRLRQSIKGVQNTAYQWRSGQRLIGKSPAMREIKKMIDSAVDVDCDTVLIQGETGTGKEVVAREIHLLGKKESAPFIAVSCPALPAELVESELFGHVKGSFTGADQDKPGCFETAHGGTLFLDEVADLSKEAQAKLLRVLETRSVRRVGGKREMDVDVNVIAATNAPLAELVKQGEFRQDLYFRLNLFTIDIPPLRERKQDIIPLAEHFLQTSARNKKTRVTGFSEEAEKMLREYDYPGNARELRNIVERAAILCKEGEIQKEHLNLHGGEPASGASASIQSPFGGEKQAIIDALERCKWNRAKAAEELGLTYAALRYRMDKYDINL